MMLGGRLTAAWTGAERTMKPKAIERRGNEGTGSG